MMRSERCSNFWRQKKCAEFISGTAKVFWGILLFPSSILFPHGIDSSRQNLPAVSRPPRASLVRSIENDNKRELHASHDLMICYVSSHLLSSHSPSLTIITTDHQYAEMISFSSREIFVRSIISAGYSQWMRECGQGAQRTWSTFRSLTHTRDATLKIVM